jgi:hypothetical protein
VGVRRTRGAGRAERPETAVPLPGPGPGPWIWPGWLQRQVDPGAPSWLPEDLAGFNRTGRNWTVIGIPEGEDRWRVDRYGLLAPSSGTWALDWWVGGADRWRLPSQQASVRQRLVEGAPVVETLLRVPGGEVAARHWAVPGEDSDLALIEIANDSAAPVAVALVLRPVGPTGPTMARRVAVVGGELTVDGVTVLRADVAPRQTLVSDSAGGDVAAVVLANATPARLDATVVCRAGWATAALVWPLPHRATLRAQIPGAPRVPGPRVPGAGRAGGRVSVPRPGPEATARGWSARVTRRTRLDLPAGPLASALEAQRRHLLLAVPAGGDRSRLEWAQVVSALSSAGQRDEAARHLHGWLDEQHANGRLGEDDIDTAATLWAMGVWARTGADDGLMSRWAGAVGRAVGRLAPRAAQDDPVAAAWAVAGVQAAARMLAQAGEEEAAAKAQRWGCARYEALVAATGAGSLRGAADGASAPLGRSMEAALLAVGLGVLGPHHPVARAGRTAARRPLTGLPAGAVVAPGPLLGLRPALTLSFAVSAALAGEYPADAVRWILSVASPTWTWPTVVAPRLGTGSHGSGHDPVVAAALWRFGRALLVADDGGGGVVAGSGVVAGTARQGVAVNILPSVPVEWLGVDFEVHGLATAAGSLAYAVRWHADRPALLWEIDGSGADPAVTAGGAEPAVTAGGLDPAWRGRGQRGEALLGVVSLAAAAAAAAGTGDGDGDGISLA